MLGNRSLEGSPVFVTPALLTAVAVAVIVWAAGVVMMTWISGASVDVKVMAGGIVVMVCVATESVL